MVELELSKSGSCLKILHVDDDSSLLVTSKLIMEDMDELLEIESVCGVNEAIKKLASGHYDAVISDYEMPEKDGLQFLKELREGKNDIPFILFTGKGREDVAIRALNLGADGYVNKHYSPETVYGELYHSLYLAVERRRSQESIRRNEEQLRAIISYAPIGIALSDHEKFFLSANEAFCKILGYTEAELQKLTFTNITHPDDLDESTRKMKDLISGRISFFNQEKRYFRKDGAIINGRVTVGEIRGSGNNPALFIAELEDITERSKNERSLLESEAKYRDLLDSLPGIVFETDATANVVFVNSKTFEITGYSREDFLKGFKALSLVAPEDKERAKENFEKVLSGVSSEGNVYLLLKKDGTKFLGIINSIPILKEGKVTGIHGIIFGVVSNRLLFKARSRN
jgi:PAS domain S-box-containing protein